MIDFYSSRKSFEALIDANLFRIMVPCETDFTGKTHLTLQFYICRFVHKIC
jgi:hypothetical protein